MPANSLSARPSTLPECPRCYKRGPVAEDDFTNPPLCPRCREVVWDAVNLGARVVADYGLIQLAQTADGYYCVRWRSGDWWRPLGFGGTAEAARRDAGVDRA